MTEEQMLAIVRSPLSDANQVQNVRRQIDLSNQYSPMNEELWRWYMGL